MSNKRLTVFLLAATLAACDGNAANPPVLDGLELMAPETDAEKFLGDGFSLQAVCGGSKGIGFYLDEADDGFSEDAITDGVIAFGENSDGRLNVVHRNALKSMVSANDYDVAITRDSISENGPLGVWTVRFQSSGIVETHNLTIASDGQAYNLWTSNKPENLLKGRVMVFVAKCELK